jgi:serine/threonine protein kinase
MANLMGQRLGQYEITALLGEGGMASVYRARQQSIKREVAIKVIKPNLTQMEDFAKRFQREAETVAALSHPYIMKIFDYGHDNDIVYIVMELLTGGSLDHVIQHRTLTYGQIARFTEQIASALDHAHRRGIIHRDLKPGNVLLNGEHDAILTDFGLSKIMENEGQTLTQTGRTMGTPVYMAPEQWMGNPVDARTDIYALGVMIYEMIAGRPPFEADSVFALMHKHIYEPVPPLTDYRADAPSSVIAVISRAMAKEPSSRFSSAGELAAAYKAALTAAQNRPPAQGTPNLAPSPAAAIAAPQTVELATGPAPSVSLYVIFQYLAMLIAEREAQEPILVSQVQPAINYKFPGFSFAAYGLTGMRDFILAGQKAGYFELINTGDPKTMYLARGSNAPAKDENRMIVEELAANDPRRMRWMTLAMEGLMSGDRADQLLDAIKGIKALTPEFDSFLAAQAKNVTYPVKGKIQRVREFLKLMREKGEGAAVATWKVSRGVLRMPAIPALAVKDAAAAQSMIWALMQGNMQLDRLSVETLNNLFFGVLVFSREQMTRNRSWDWVTGLELLEADARAVPRPAPPKKGGLFGGGKPAPNPYALDDAEIARIVATLMDAAGLNAVAANRAPVYKGYVDATGSEGAIRFLTDHPELLENDTLVEWLDGQINACVADNNPAPVKNLATKAAVVVAARQYGLAALRTKANELKAIYDSVLESARILTSLFTFIKLPTPGDAVKFFREHTELNDHDTIITMFEDQITKATREGDVEWYRQISLRLDLWRNIVEFGPELGLKQHQRMLANPPDDKAIQIEMAISLLTQSVIPEDRREIIERFPAIATQDGLRVINGILETLSFNNASTEEYNRYFDVKRLVDRCIDVGVDRALSELK